MTSNLAGRVESALRSLGDRPWLPELTTEIAEVGWHGLCRNAGLSPAVYGTARVMALDASMPRRIAAVLRMLPSAESPWSTVQVENLEAEVARSYEEAGIRFFSAGEIVGAGVLKQLEEAIKFLKPIPTLFTTVAALVRSIHLIDAGDDNYDVSFSEPLIPFSIFISAPKEQSAINALRIAESIVHETMHLQLTLIEQLLPLVRSTGRLHYSPWRNELRNAQGIVHGLYVFCVIDKFMLTLRNTAQHDFALITHIDNRRSEIRDQVAQISSFRHSEDLTEFGAKFTQRVMALLA